jgi:hypothetical protein
VGYCISFPNIIGEKESPNDLAILLIPPAALLSSDLTNVAT